MSSLKQSTVDLGYNQCHTEQEKLETEILKTDLNHILSKPDVKNNKYMQIINETHGEEILFKKAN